MNPLIDSHCHLDFPAFDAIFEQEIADCTALGFKAVVVPGVAQSSWGRLTEKAKGSGMLFSAYGLHPYFLNEHQREHIQALADVLLVEQGIAVGEFGLDYFDAKLDRQEQQFYFDAQLDLAAQLNLPAILHVRKAHDEVLKSLRKANLPRGGAIHAFSGSEQQAQQYIELGFKLGFGGALSYTRATKLRGLVATLPLESLLLETDAPDMPPSFLAKGEINKPQYLLETAKIIAQLRGEPLEHISRVTASNADRLFGLGLSLDLG